MTNAQELYATSIAHLPPDERLQLATLILDGLAQKTDSGTARRSALELLESLPGRRLFKTSAEADEYLREERESWER